MLKDELDKMTCRFDELDKLKDEFDELDKLNCKFHELDKLRSLVSWIIKNNYMEGSGSATIKQCSPSQAPRGRGNLSKQKPHNYW